MKLDLQDIDVQRLLTNDIFTDDECSRFKSQQAAAVEDLAELDTEIAFANLNLESDTPPLSTRQLSIARRKRRCLLSFISACNIATAPQKHLPAELLSYIFALAFDGYSSYLPPTERYAQGPLSLCHTCSRWREVALKTPELWADIVFWRSRGLDPYKTLEIAKEWFSRSGASTPLSLEIAPWPDREYSADHEEVIQVLCHQLVMPYSTRFRKLKLRMPEAEIYSLLTRPALHFSALESLLVLRDSYVKNGWSWPDSPHDDHLPFKHAPRLTKVELYGFDRFQDHDQGIDTFFSWKNITYLSFDNCPLSVAQIHIIIRKCRRLVECKLSINTVHTTAQDNDPNSQSKSRIELDKLRNLDVTFRARSTDLLAQFFGPLHAPSLKELSISSTRLLDWPADALVNVVKTCKKSGCDIEILSIHGISLAKETITGVIHALPSLSVLRVGVDNLLPWAILEGIANGDLLHQLTTLVCRVDHLETAICMLEKRWEKSSGFNAQYARPAFYMIEYVGEVITREQATRIDRLRADGVEIEMEHIHSRRY